MDHGECLVIGAMVRYAPLSVIHLSHEVVVLPLSILHDIVALVLPFVVEHTPCIVQRWRNKPPGVLPLNMVDNSTSSL